jgi:hypothetical protein
MPLREAPKVLYSLRFWVHIQISFLVIYNWAQWKGSNCKQSARWQHVSQLKASAFGIW